MSIKSVTRCNRGELARAGHIWRVRTVRPAWPLPILALMHITVDYDLCEGQGQCLLAAPDVFDIPAGAEQVVVLDPDPPEADRESVIRARPDVSRAGDPDPQLSGSVSATSSSSR
jgi:ferredoxin